MKRFLVAEDNDDARDLQIRLIKMINPKIEIAAAIDSTSAIRALAKNSFDLIISDFNFPGEKSRKDGCVDVLRYMAERNITTPFVIVTGDGYQALQRLKETGLRDRVHIIRTKPYDYEFMETLCAQYGDDSKRPAAPAKKPFPRTQPH